jgi:LPXTG-motif cell wall-anchored protein
LSVTKTAAYTVSKVWGNDAIISDVKVWVFREKEYADGSVSATSYIGSKTLNEDNNWIATLTGVEQNGTDDVGSFTWRYYVAESTLNLLGYRTYYTDSLGNIIDYVTRDVTVDGLVFKGLRMYRLESPVIITNQSKTLTVKKVWADDEAGADSVTVGLYRIKTPVYNSSSTDPINELVTTFTLNKKNNWTATYTATSYETDYNTFMSYYADYYVAEIPVEGYTDTYSYNDGSDNLVPIELEVNGISKVVYPAAKDVTITNSEKPTNYITVKKEWADGATKEPVQVMLFAKMTQVNSETGQAYSSMYLQVLPGDDLPANERYWQHYNGNTVVTLDESNGWTYTWNNLLTDGDNSGFQIEYFIYEVNTGEYTPVYYDGSGQEITTKKWSRENSLEDGRVSAFKGMMSSIGTETIYVAPVTYGTTTIKNTPKTLTITKTWAGTEGADSVTVTVYRKKTKIAWNGKSLPLDPDDPDNEGELDSERAVITETWDHFDVTLTAGNSWTATIDAPDLCIEGYDENDKLIYNSFSQIVPLDNDKPNAPKTVYTYSYEYYILEQSVDGYTATYLDNTTGGYLTAEEIATGEDTAVTAYKATDNVEIINLQGNTVTVKKVWADGTTPEPVKVMLFAEVTENGETALQMVTQKGTLYPSYNSDYLVELNESNGWEYTWTGLTQSDDIKYYIYELYTGKYTVTYFSNGEEAETKPSNFVFRINEAIKTSGTTSSYYLASGDSVAAVDFGIATVKNAKNVRTITLTKSWLGGEGADSVTVNVYQKAPPSTTFGGQRYSDFEIMNVTLSADNNWTATIEVPNSGLTDDLKSFVQYEYYILEQSVDGYTATYLDNTTGEYLEKSNVSIEAGKVTLTPDAYKATDNVLIVNSSGYELPHTGGATPQLYTFGGAALVILAVSLMIINRRKKRIRGRGGGSGHPA